MRAAIVLIISLASVAAAPQLLLGALLHQRPHHNPRPAFGGLGGHVAPGAGVGPAPPVAGAGGLPGRTFPLFTIISCLI